MSTDRKTSLPSQQFGDRQLVQLQREVNAVLRAMQAIPFANGCVDLGDVSLPTAASTPIAHKLGRKLRGWLPYAIRSNPGGSVVEVSRDAVNLTLYANVAMTVGVLVW